MVGLRPEVTKKKAKCQKTFADPLSWERTEESWFVDKSGWGQEWEPALTWNRLKDELREYIAHNPRHGFGITEEGQFQLYVTAFRPAEALTEGEAA